MTTESSENGAITMPHVNISVQERHTTLLLDAYYCVLFSVAWLGFGFDLLFR